MRNGFGWWRLAKQVVLGMARSVSAVYSTLSAADFAPTADGATTDVVTFTAKDASNAVVPGLGVTFSVHRTLIDAGACTLGTDATEILTTSGVANIEAYIYEQTPEGHALPGIPAASLVLASTGSNNTITAVDTHTDQNGRFRWTFSSTTAEAKTLSLTACGLAITDTAAVTVTATPGAPALVFETIWSSTGTTDAALRSTGEATPWEYLISPSSTALSVVSAASEGVDTGCPTTNVLRVDVVYNGDGIQNMDTKQVTNLPGGGAWTIPAVGESVYFCVYKRLVYPHGSDPGPLGNNNHCLEQASGGSNDWSWNFNTAAGGWNPSFNLWNGGAASRYLLGGVSAPTYLDRDKWYRLEWRVHRTGTTTAEFEIRIYDETVSTTVPEYTAADFLTTGDAALSAVSKTITDVNEWDAVQLGTNGPNVVGATQGAAPGWYFAAMRVSRVGWIGAYA